MLPHSLLLNCVWPLSRLWSNETVTDINDATARMHNHRYGHMLLGQWDNSRRGLVCVKATLNVCVLLVLAAAGCWVVVCPQSPPLAHRTVPWSTRSRHRAGAGNRRF